MKESKIEWTDSTVNFWMGCNKISTGCKYCYMYRMMEKDGKSGNSIQRVGYETFYKAYDWKKPRRIFTCSMSDFFLAEADEWRKDAWKLIKQTPQHQWQILTKRPERIQKCLPDDWGSGYNNVWIGVSIENQAYLHRAEILSKIPAHMRFVSAEPLIGEIDFAAAGKESILQHIHWCIIGGESGNDFGKYRYRECKIEWIEKLMAEMKANDVKVFVKQLGTFQKEELHLKDSHAGDMSEWAQHLQVREYPDTHNNCLNNINVKEKVIIV